MPKTEAARTRRQTKPGDVFGECPKCGERWELIDSEESARLAGESPDKWECDHCGYTLSIAACINAHADLLAACEAAVADYEKRTGNTSGIALRWVEQARAAIRKAKGDA